MSKVYYKVVVDKDSKLYSPISLMERHKGSSVEYIIGEWVRPKFDSPLFVFDNLLNAKNLGNYLSEECENIKIYECIIKPYEKNIVRLLSLDGYKEGAIEKFWDVFNNENIYYGSIFDPYPPECITALSVKLTNNEIKPDIK